MAKKENDAAEMSAQQLAAAEKLKALKAGTEKIEKSSHGTGACYASAFTGAIMQGKSELEAAKLAADFVVETIKQIESQMLVRNYKGFLND